MSIVVPVFNAFEELRVCLDSLARNTTHPANLILIDDASPDPRVWPHLLQFAQDHGSVRVVRNEKNRGFVATVNRGFDLAGDDDVVILNADTEVPPRWLQHLCIAAQDPRVGTVTALSNNAGAFSAPRRGEVNPLGYDIERTGRAVAQHAAYTYPVVPTGNGFCMWVRRRVLEETGGFDAATFGRGYCEENDLCMRARAAGWRNVIADGLLVAHRGSASFGQEKARQLKINRALLDRQHPDYNDAVKVFLDDPLVAEARERVATALSVAGQVRPRVLFVLHGGGGGTPLTNSDLMIGVGDRYQPLLLRCVDQSLVLTDGESNEEYERIALSNPISPTAVSDPEYSAAVHRILVDYAIELVHVRHLQGHTHDIPDVATTLDIPVVISLHDYYSLCPSTQLLDEHDRFCAGTCTPGQGVCRTPPGLEATPHLKHGFVHEWRAEFARVLATADAFVTTSRSAREHLVRGFDGIAPHLYQIEHGRQFRRQEHLASAPVADEPIRLLVPGVIGIHKGAKLISELSSLDVDGRFEFHLIGSMTRQVEVAGLVDHGPYKREDFNRLAAEIAPAATLALSIWAETYSHTVSESWAAGIPVIGSELGAIGERIRRYGGGWTIDVTDPQRAYQQILDALADREDWEAKCETARVDNVVTTETMVSQYLDLYGQVLANRRSFTR